MTLGEHLASLRREKGMTQQELGDHLSISAQAISKWENNLSEPDLSTLKKLATLYEVPISTLIGYEDSASSPTYDTSASADTARYAPLGFCTSCGITVTEENVGESSPKVLCRSCVEAREAAAVAAREDSERRRRAREEGERRELAGYVGYMKRKLIISSVVSGIFAVAVLILGLIGAFSGGGSARGVLVVGSIVLTVLTFTFVSGLFYEGAVRDVLFEMATKTFQWPGLIFTFDLDGFLWLIGMKILFAILGFVGGVLCALLGVVAAVLISPFIYPFRTAKIIRCIVKKDVAKYKRDLE